MGNDNIAALITNQRDIKAISKYLFVSVFVVVIQLCYATAYAQSRLHNMHNNSNSWQKNNYNQNTRQKLLNRELNRQINPQNWRNSADNWKYKTRRFTNEIGIFDSDGSRIKYRDPRENKIVVKPYSNGRDKLIDRVSP